MPDDAAKQSELRDEVLVFGDDIDTSDFKMLTPRGPRGVGWTPDMLTPQHLKELMEGSSISLEVIKARGYRSIKLPYGGWRAESYLLKDYNFLRALKFSRDAVDPKIPARWPILWIPQYDPSGTWSHSGQIKPHSPPKGPDRRNADGTVKLGKSRKYFSPTGKATQIDVHPSSKDHVVDPKVPMWIVEGVKKADSLTSRGKFAVALTGVWNFRTKDRTHPMWDDIVIRGRSVIVCYDADAQTNPSVAMAMRRLGMIMRGKGATVTFVVTPSEFNGLSTKGVDDFFAAGGTIDDLERSFTKKAPDPARHDDRFTARWFARSFCDDVLEGSYHWLGTPKQWLRWNDVNWETTTETLVIKEVCEWLDVNFRDAVEHSQRGESGADYSEVEGWLSLAKSPSRIRSTAELPRGDVEKEYNVFDKDPHLLNCPNGVVDLRTGELLDHSPDLLMTKCAGAAYDPAATHPDWDTALLAIPEEIRSWYQLRMGQAIIGETPSDGLLLLARGGGNNGKTTINSATAKAAGSYCVHVSDRLLMPSNPNSIPVEILSLRGARYAIMEETPEAKRLNSQRLKHLIATPTIATRVMYAANEVVFDATHTMVVSTNHMPIVDESDDGTWRRLAFVPFPYRYRKLGELMENENDRTEDPGLISRVANDPAVMRAVLRWMVDGARRWYAEGPGELPPMVRAGTKAWKAESDTVSEFADEFLVAERDRYIVTTELHGVYREWMERRGLMPLGDRGFFSRLRETSLVRNNNIESKKVRRSSMVSHLGSYAAQPLQCRAWVNVRWSTASDE